ncbi:hypothetical protein RUE5091_04437 [Ruegeria denitrificans]|uniref:Uncharacterized protein n=1 Tax=Ruegeria denitrificans TaxID=1715692 RepID=A0A0P1IKJ4_9RHOB|nr:hypothetical protein RUE5091_04437 [Ruegeria denitrificans]
MLEALLPLLIFTLVILVIWLIFSVVGDMARARGHSPWPWWIISLCWSPFGSMLVLWIFFDVVDEGQVWGRVRLSAE